MHPDLLARPPTPLEYLPRLSADLGVRLYVKRDDEGGWGGGGNKVRKLQGQLAAARDVGCDCVVLAAHPQSNAARQVVGCAARLGFRPTIVVRDLIDRPTEAFRTSGNRFLLDLMAARLEPAADGEDFGAAVERVAEALRIAGSRPFVLPFGASDALGARGYADCAGEILAQVQAAEGRAPDVIALATGSGGTQAGLAAGVSWRGADTLVLGFTILHRAEDIAGRVRTMASEVLGGRELRAELSIVDERALGEGYGIPTQAGLEAIRRLACTEGLFLDPVYTGKAMAGLISWIREGRAPGDAVVVFVHTGGLPLLFAYADVLGPADYPARS